MRAKASEAWWLIEDLGLPRPLTLLASALVCCAFQQNEGVQPLPEPSCDSIQAWAQNVGDDEGAIVHITYQHYDYGDAVVFPAPASFERDCGVNCEPSEAFSALVRQVSPMSRYLWLPELMIAASRCFTSEVAITQSADERFQAVDATAVVEGVRLEFSWAEDSCGSGQTVEVAGFNGCASIRATHQ